MRQSARITIGQAVADLKSEFPDVDIKESKIRHLENEGLIAPERTPSGYRKYSVTDMEKLRYIIRAQQEHYLPLRVIREHLDALDRGLEAPPVSGSPSIPGALMTNPAPGVESLLSGTSDVRDLPARARQDRRDHRGAPRPAGELRPGPHPGRVQALRLGRTVIAKVAGELAAYGIEPRHLRAFKTAADREVGLLEQVLSPIRRSREDGAEGRAAQTMDEMAVLSVRLHAALVKTGLRSLR